MSTKKKLIISISTLCVAVIAIVGITVGVLAARSASITNNINVGYTAREVAATISATYQRQGDADPTNMTVQGGEPDQYELVFDGSEETATGALETAGDITLDTDHKSVTFTYTFKNNGTNNFTATLTLPETQKNVTITYQLDGEPYDPADHGSALTFTATGAASAEADDGQEVTFAVTVAIDNVAADASFAGTFSWNLTSVGA